MNLLLLIVILSFVGCASGRPPSARSLASRPVQVSPRFIGHWVATRDCEKPVSWSDDLEILRDLSNPDLILMKRGDGPPSIFAGESDVLADDPEGMRYRTIRLSESYNGGRQVVLGSLWRSENVSSETRSPRGLSVMVGIYKLQDDRTLVFEKYGYETEERPGDLMVQPYQKSFPRNYRCVFRRKG